MTWLIILASFLLQGIGLWPEVLTDSDLGSPLQLVSSFVRPFDVYLQSLVHCVLQSAAFPFCPQSSKLVLLSWFSLINSLMHVLCALSISSLIPLHLGLCLPFATGGY